MTEAREFVNLIDALPPQSRIDLLKMLKGEHERKTRRWVITALALGWLIPSPIAWPSLFDYFLVVLF